MCNLSYTYNYFKTSIWIIYLSKTEVRFFGSQEFTLQKTPLHLPETKREAHCDRRPDVTPIIAQQPRLKRLSAAEQEPGHEGENCLPQRPTNAHRPPMQQKTRTENDNPPRPRKGMPKADSRRGRPPSGRVFRLRKETQTAHLSSIKGLEERRSYAKRPRQAGKRLKIGGKSVQSR